MTVAQAQDTTTSKALADLWKDFAEADGTSAVGAKAKDAVKGDYDALAKASDDITQVVDAYRKVSFQLLDQFTAFELFTKDERYTKQVSAGRIKAIDEAVDKYVDRIDRRELEIRRPGYGNDLEESFQKATVEFEGMKKHADLLQKRFDELKGELETIKARHKGWAEAKEKAEKAYAEQKFERAYFYLAYIKRRLAGKKPIAPADLRLELLKLWGWLLEAKRLVREARTRFDKAQAHLDQAKKRLDQLNKTGVQEVIQDLDLDAPERVAAADGKKEEAEEK